MRYHGEGLDTVGVSDLASTYSHEQTRTNQGFYRETCAPASFENAQITTFGLLVEAGLFRLTGWFHIHLFLFI